MDSLPSSSMEILSLLFNCLRRLAKHPAKDLLRQVDRLINRIAHRYGPMVYLRLSGEPQTGEDAGSQVDQRPVYSRHIHKRVKHQRILAPESFAETRPSNTSDGLYWRCCSHKGHVTTTETKGNSFTPAGIISSRSWQRTTNCFGEPRNMRKA
jgi:hypothetical protein